MGRGRRLITTATCVALGALLVVATAQASDSSVRAAIENSSKQVKESGELQQALKEIKDNPKTIAKLQKGLKEFETALTKVVTTVESQEASTSTGKEGEADWLGGVHKVIKGFKELGAGLTALKSGHRSEAKTEVKQAGALVKEGTALGRKGDTLLGVKSS
jgi:septal ring factor EnvC (AmiA/AmiB activator)